MNLSKWKEEKEKKQEERHLSPRDVCFSHFGGIDLAAPSFQPVLSFHKHAQVHAEAPAANKPCSCKPPL